MLKSGPDSQARTRGSIKARTGVVRRHAGSSSCRVAGINSGSCSISQRGPVVWMSGSERDGCIRRSHPGCSRRPRPAAGGPDSQTSPTESPRNQSTESRFILSGLTRPASGLLAVVAVSRCVLSARSSRQRPKQVCVPRAIEEPAAAQCGCPPANFRQSRWRCPSTTEAADDCSPAASGVNRNGRLSPCDAARLRRAASCG